jgi:hypothetical protein
MAECKMASLWLEELVPLHNDNICLLTSSNEHREYLLPWTAASATWALI